MLLCVVSHSLSFLWIRLWAS